MLCEIGSNQPIQESVHGGRVLGLLLARRERLLKISMLMSKNLVLMAVLWVSFFQMSCAQDHTNGSLVKRRLGGVLGTYNNPPRKMLSVDPQKLISELEDIHANTYNWMIWSYTNDWDDLKIFLPLAQENNIKVWVTVMPPSESKPIVKCSSEPYGLDYERWAKEIALLSLKHTNLVAWSIDDFVHNLTFYTPEYTGKMLAAASDINPALAFIPCCYYKKITPAFVQKYKLFLHGILFPYRAESHTANLTDHQYVAEEISRIRELVGGEIPIFLDIYAHAHSRLGASTPEYVQKVLEAGRKSADGVLIYCHQNPVRSKEKYQIIKSGFQ